MLPRWTWVLPLVLCSANASARSYRPRHEPAIPRHDFWRDAIEPHSYDLARLLELARRALRTVEEAVTNDTGWAADARRQYALDAYHLMRHARTLSPANLEVLAVLGRAADEAGKTAEAREAFEAHTRIATPEKATADVIARLGGIYLRLGELDRAIEILRFAQSAPNTVERVRDQALATIYLAHALAARGDTTGAIDVLVAAAPTNATYYYYGSGSAVLGFALAVMYDRIEQRGAAFEQLDKLQSVLSQAGTRNYSTHLQDELARIPFTPAEDLHYYRALLYESLAKYVEARAEWVNYAAIPDAAWRPRALAHIAAIDARQRAVPVDPNAGQNQHQLQLTPPPTPPTP